MGVVVQLVGVGVPVGAEVGLVVGMAVGAEVGLVVGMGVVVQLDPCCSSRLPPCILPDPEAVDGCCW